MSEAQYQTIVRHYASQRSYYPGKYVYRLFLKVLRLEEPEPDQLRMDPATPAEEAELFVNALTHASRHTARQRADLSSSRSTSRFVPSRPVHRRARRQSGGARPTRHSSAG